MEVRFHNPADRGVTTLMYVGDDDAVDKVVAAPTPLEIGTGALALLLALRSRGAARVAAAGVAGYVGWRMISSRHA